MPDGRKTKKSVEKTIDEKINQKIDSALSREIGPELDQKIEELVSEKLKEKVAEEISAKIEEKTTFPETKTVEQKEQVAPEKINPLVRSVNEFRTNFHLCWRGSCRTISWIILPTYTLVLFLLVFCSLSQRCGLVKGSVLSTIVLYVIVAVVIVSLIFSLFSRYPRTALIFWILLDIPLLIIILIFAAKFVALIVLSLILLLRIIQMVKMEY